jgi:hypothetical protein
LNMSTTRRRMRRMGEEGSEDYTCFHELTIILSPLLNLFLYGSLSVL